MNAAASDFSGPLPGFGFGGVKPFAVGMGPTAVEKRCAKQREESEPMHWTETWINGLRSDERP